MTSNIAMIKFNKYFFPLFIIILTAAIILYRFSTLPKFLALDEVEFTKLALSLDGKPYTPYSALATGHSTLYFYIILLFLKIFGINSFALRLPSALSGILCGFIFYKIIYLVSKKRGLAFLSAFILLSSRWFFGFARFAFEPTFLLCLELTATYFLFHYFQSKRKFDLILTGVFTGLAYNSYTPGRIFFLLPLFFLIFFIKKKAFNFQTFRAMLYFLIPFIILIFPLQLYLSTHEDIRFNQLFFFSNQKLSIEKKVQFVGQNIAESMEMFVMKGDPNGKHNYPFKPALNPILAFLFITGLILGMKSMKRNEYRFFLGYALISILPTLLVYPWENPSMLRTYTILPSIAFFSTIPFSLLTQLKSDSKKKIFMTTMVILIILSTFYELRTYFVYQAQVFQHSFEIKKDLQTAIHCRNIFDCTK